MGDVANGHDCDAFILAFADDIIDRYRSQLLDQTFGDKVRYYVMADEDWSVRLFAAIQTNESGKDKTEEHFCLEHATRFFPTSDDIIDQVLREFPDLDEEEVERRLQQGREESERETQRTMQVLTRTTCPGWLITENGDIEPCKVCNPQSTADEAYDRAAIWARGLPKHPRHQDHEECSGCCGFDAFGCIGSSTQGGHAILRNHACGVFEDDDQAQVAARSLYAERWTPCAPTGASSIGSTGEAAPGGDRP